MDQMMLSKQFTSVKTAFSSPNSSPYFCRSASAFIFPLFTLRKIFAMQKAEWPFPLVLETVSILPL